MLLLPEPVKVSVDPAALRTDRSQFPPTSRLVEVVRVRVPAPPRSPATVLAEEDARVKAAPA
jgi:hypothetical protein